MNLFHRLSRLVLCACLVAGFSTLAGCTNTVAQRQSDSSTDEATQNRSYMATLNRQTADLQTALDAFQKAVAEEDAVTMQAQLNTVEEVIDSVKNTDATSRLSSVKDGYVDALCTLDDAMKSYVALYADVKNGMVDAADYQARLAEVQRAYDDGIQKMKDADQTVSDLANG